MSKRILVVDDEPDFTRLLKVGLEQLGGFVVCEENVSTNALQTARDFDPDAIILDIMMPNLDGSELAALIQQDEILKRTPLIFLTALVAEEEVHRGSFVRGGRMFMPKPVDLSRLADCLREQTTGSGSGSAGDTAALAG
jgi:two-component system, OmpR family, response regulator